MSIAIMQPYFLPYIGYWQLINAVDKFVIYDNIKFTKKSWIRRNSYLLNETKQLFTLPLKHDSDFLDIRERFLVDDFYLEKDKILKRIEYSYRRAPYFEDGFPIIEKCFSYSENNLFQFIYHSIHLITEYLDINTPIIVSSDIDMEHTLTNKDRVIGICKALLQKKYINPIGGVTIYSKEEFLERGIELQFLKANCIEYKQFNNEFIPNLSIIDIMMFNSKDKIKMMLGDYELL